VKELQDILREARSLPDEFTALATVVRTAGTSYRRPSARLLMRQDGKSIGAISGNCLEDSVVLRARDVQQLVHSFVRRKALAITTVFQTTAPDDLPLGLIATSSEDRYLARSSG